MKKLIVGISGATGAIYGIRLLEVLKEKGIETHLILSEWAKENILYETEYSIDEVEGLASVVHNNNNLGSSIASGSFKVSGMVILPCSMKTLSAVRHGYSDNLLTRAADVNIKEKRKLVIAPREMPLSSIHLENMLKLSLLGVVIMPPMPAFYNKPTQVMDLVDHTVARILDQFDIENSLIKRWDGLAN